jgi:RNA polymerase sigma factor (sigma-70 family)
VLSKDTLASKDVISVDDIWTRARNGDRVAEREILQFLLVRFNLLTKRRLGGREAEDVAQDACLTVLEKCRSGTSARYSDAWAYAILRNKIGNYLQTRETHRKTMVEESALGNIDQFPQPAEIPGLKVKLVDCLRKIMKIQPRYARVLSLTYQGYKTDEICRRLSIKPSHLYVILNRSRKMLNDCIEKGKSGG